MEVNLIVANGKLLGKKIPIAKPQFLIGRGEECNLRPQSSLVSRKHCVILVEKDSAAIEDFGSTNGTFLNGEKLTERQALKDGDRIKVGMLELEVQLAVAEKKKGGIHTVQQAAARTVATATISDDDFDVSRWLGEDEQTTITPARKDRSVGDDTMSGKGSMVDTTAIPIPPPHQEPPKKQEEEKQKRMPPQPATKMAGKILRSQPKPTSESSSSAADDALKRHFLHKKSP
jgi:predicted component of type VI protein secretion system